MHLHGITLVAVATPGGFRALLRIAHHHRRPESCGRPRLTAAQSLNLEGHTCGVITPFATVPDAPGLSPVVSFQTIVPGDTFGTRFLITLGASVGGRGEFGYTRAAIATGDAGDVGQLFDRGFHGVHGKLVLLHEDATPGVPAIAVGGRVRWNSEELRLANPMRNGDVFVVVTKSFDVSEGTSVQVNGGVKMTNASLFGFAGTAEGWTARGFGAVAVTTANGKVSAGAEILQQPRAFEGLPEAEVPATISTPTLNSPPCPGGSASASPSSAWPANWPTTRRPCPGSTSWTRKPRPASWWAPRCASDAVRQGGVRECRWRSSSKSDRFVSGTPTTRTALDRRERWRRRRVAPMEQQKGAVGPDIASSRVGEALGRSGHSDRRALGDNGPCSTPRRLSRHPTS